MQAATREGGLGWFATHLVLLPVLGGGTEPQSVRISGVLMRREADWRLLSLHLSRADTAAAAHSARAATVRDAAAPSPDGAAAPREGG